MAKRKWSVMQTVTPGKGVWVSEGNSVVYVPKAEVEEFIKHVFSAVTGREFMGAHYAQPREEAERG